MSRQIAPALRGLVEEPWTADGGGVSTKDARRELRALLAAAKALDHMLAEDRNREPGTIHCSWMEAAERGRRALSRLSRASGAKGGGR